MGVNILFGCLGMGGLVVSKSMHSHDEYMRLALKEAQKAAEIDEVPVGAVLVSASGEILAAAHNRTIVEQDPPRTPRFWRCAQRPESFGITGC